ncbi:DUF484 family protein [Rheinheimera marina]|uniref:DUF484 family protein n=1 Tax=Rheinheimera marina TaxID=1774958 RepID=A0ABV9JS37_9GAMM
MTTTPLAPELLEASLVLDYLQDHPEFFLEHPELLNKLRLPHQQRGVVSLVERQQELQRDKIRALEDDITRLMGIARQNELIFYALNQLHLQLLGQPKLGFVAALQQFVNAMPYVQRAELINLTAGPHHPALPLLLQRRLTSKGYYFGRLNKDEQQALFDQSIHSVALMKVDTGLAQAYLLAFGSESDEHFQPGMDTLFLDHLAKLAKVALSHGAEAN